MGNETLTHKQIRTQVSIYSEDREIVTVVDYCSIGEELENNTCV